MRAAPLVRTECGAARCTAIVDDVPCAGRMEVRGTRLPSDPGRLYCTRCNADQPLPEVAEDLDRPELPR